MLSYQHSYHAGNFADVIKHITLVSILNYLTQKESPLFYFESHAGRGLYDLSDAHAVKTGEAQNGIQLLWQRRHSLSSLLSPYLAIINRLNPNGTLRYYPGSPTLAIDLLRNHDRLFLSELHPQEFEFLSHNPKQGKRVFYSAEDGLTKLKSLLPPMERRGLIFLDPSYEVKDEYVTIARAVSEAVKCFAHGVYCVWYPILAQQHHVKLLKALALVPRPHLQIEFYLSKLPQSGMYGCGLWVINPPYTLKNELQTILPELCEVFNPTTSEYRLSSEE